jgi:hypothetical protein
MQQKININIAVDTVQALSKLDLLNNTYAMDNSIFGSLGQGTPYLVTACVPGQTIHWVATPIDLQTPVCIKSITFLGAWPQYTGQVANTSMSALDLYTWTGILPYTMLPGVTYKYKLELQIGNGQYSVLHLETLSLAWNA